jgi:hypothetical protein
MVSVYLDYANPKTAPEGWHACAQFALAVSNPNDPSIYTVSRKFVGRIDDLWGFSWTDFDACFPLHQTLITDSSPRSAIGDSPGSPI